MKQCAPHTRETLRTFLSNSIEQCTCSVLLLLLLPLSGSLLPLLTPALPKFRYGHHLLARCTDDFILAIDRLVVELVEDLVDFFLGHAFPDALVVLLATLNLPLDIQASLNRANSRTVPDVLWYFASHGRSVNICLAQKKWRF
ncbi:uncharacterized protein M421DRAFT_267017, partial [Didymella exigua CBS 183.55]